MNFDGPAALSQVKRADERLDEVTSTLADTVFEGRSDDGKVKVKVTGDLKAKRVLLGTDPPSDPKDLAKALEQALDAALGAYRAGVGALLAGETRAA